MEMRAELIDEASLGSKSMRSHKFKRPSPNAWVPNAEIYAIARIGPHRSVFRALLRSRVAHVICHASERASEHRLE